MILNPFGEAIVGGFKGHFEELLTSADMLSDKGTVMEYSSNRSISLAGLQKYLWQGIILFINLILPAV